MVGLAPTIAQDLEAGFRNPPDSAKPHVWWHWMNGNITAAGLAKDIQEMKKVGLGGAQIFNVDDGIPLGPVKYLSPEWLALFKHAVEEADKVGLELCFHNCAGWSSSGGPWVTPDLAMQKLEWSERRVTGPAQFAEALAQPQVVRGYYRDIAVLAFPTPLAELVRMADRGPKLTGSAERFDGARLTDGNPGTWTTLARPATGNAWVSVELDQPLAARSLNLVTGPGRNGHAGEIQVSDDGTVWRKLRDFAIPQREPGAVNCSFDFPSVTSRYYRVLFTRFDGRSRNVGLAELDLSAAQRIDNWAVKAGFDRWGPILPPAGDDVGDDACIDPAKLINLTASLDAAGKLTWDVPAGDWTILRFGHTCTGKDNHPAPASGTGLESDKLSREASDAFWRKGIDPILDQLGPLAGRTLNNILIDSYEVGYQTWTAKLPDDFRARRGYDPVAFLPACTGRIVGSLVRSERFLWDYRKTLAELFDDNYFGYFAEQAHKRGMQLSAEAYGNGNFDNLTAGGIADIPMTEFWSGSNQGDPSGAKQASSIAHTYGRRFVGAESFTTSPEVGGWRTDPWFVKALGDRMWAYGVNRFIFHRYAQQPWTDLRPGMTMSRWGMWFEWPITWWNQAPAWTGYLARGQWMLQTGRFVGDALYFVGDSSPNQLIGLDPGLPPGYDYDQCDPTVLLQHASVKDGRVALDSGESYALLVLPNNDVMLPATAAKVRDLVRAGAVVVGPRPSRSPSLAGGPDADAQVAAVGREVWADCDGQAVKEHAFGQGRVVWNQPLEALLTKLAGGPDVTFEGPSAGSMTWMHRRDGEVDYWFVASSSPGYGEVTGDFRVSGKRVELWHPDRGTVEPAPVWESAGGRTRVTLPLEPCGSLFVVFRGAPPPAAPITAVRRDGPAAEKPPAGVLVVDKAVYGVFDQPDDRVDLTDKVKAELAAGRRAIPATNAFAGRDPAQNVVKELRIDFTVGGEKRSQRVEENATLTLPEGAEVVLAWYGLVDDRPAGEVDVTKQLQALVKDGRIEVTASNGLAGDPVPLVVKQMRVDYHYNGVAGTRVVNENQVLRLPPDSNELGEPPAYDLAVDAAGKRWLTAWQPGTYTVGLAGGGKAELKLAPPVPAAVEGAWMLRFPPNLGAPPEVTLPKLISWTEHPEPGVRYFSGTAEYVRDLTIPAALLGPGRALELDLGKVRNFAEVTLNGHEFGVLWKPPFRVDITDVAKTGRNVLSVKVTNLWANRLIGDEQIDDGRQWGSDGRLLAWPDWVVQGQPKPADGRVAWTTWRHYTKGAPLQESGLIGPVTLRAGVRREVRVGE